jgi:Nif11 domain
VAREAGGAREFLQKVAEAERLSDSVKSGDVDNAVTVAKEHGYEVDRDSLWKAIVDLQRTKDDGIPRWSKDRLRVAVHD